jgi:hypothetical protein
MKVKINGSCWLLKTTPLALRVNGDGADYLIDYLAKTVLICVAGGVESAAQAAATAIAFISDARFPDFQRVLEPSPQVPVVRFSGCYVTGLSYPTCLDAPWDRLAVAAGCESADPRAR